MTEADQKKRHLKILYDQWCIMCNDNQLTILPFGFSDGLTYQINEDTSYL